jgi:SsrA-binding protein
LLHGYQPNRSRFILLHKKEIGKIAARLSQWWYTLVLTKLYNKKSLIKCEIWLARKKKNIVKKQIMKERDIDRQTKRDIKMVG